MEEEKEQQGYQKSTRETIGLLCFGGRGSDDCYSVTCEGEITNTWILDSGCYYHMCPNRKWFTTYRGVEGGTLLMENNHPCKTMGLGSIRIRMHFGVVRTLTDIRHVPELKKNLIFVGSLDSGGCKIITNNGEIKVVCGSLVVMKSISQANLYALLGTTVTGNVAVAAIGSG